MGRIIHDTVCELTSQTVSQVMKDLVQRWGAPWPRTTVGECSFVCLYSHMRTAIKREHPIVEAQHSMIDAVIADEVQVIVKVSTCSTRSMVGPDTKCTQAALQDLVADYFEVQNILH